MKTIVSILTVLAVLGVGLVSTVDSVRSTAFADDKAHAINKNCPVGKEPIDGESFSTYKGKTIGYCCPGCDKRFQAWSEKRKDAFVTKALGDAPTSKPAGEATKSDRVADLWTEPYPFDTCRVSGEKLEKMGGAVVKVIHGRELRFCCKRCVRQFRRKGEHFLVKLDETIAKDQRPFYPLKKCIVTGTPLSAGKSLDVVIGNRLFVVSGDDARKSLAKDPAKYVAILDKAIADSQRSQYPLDKCMVSGAKLGAMGDPAEMVIAGRLIQFCCGGCKPKVTANPGSFIGMVDEGWRARGKYDRPTSQPTSKPKREDDGGQHGHDHEGHDH